MEIDEGSSVVRVGVRRVVEWMVSATLHCFEKVGCDANKVNRGRASSVGIGAVGVKVFNGIHHSDFVKKLTKPRLGSCWFIGINHEDDGVVVVT